MKGTLCDDRSMCDDRNRYGDMNGTRTGVHTATRVRIYSRITPCSAARLYCGKSLLEVK